MLYKQTIIDTGKEPPNRIYSSLFIRDNRKFAMRAFYRLR
jgi:hypothetical protein